MEDLTKNRTERLGTMTADQIRHRENIVLSFYVGPRERPGLGMDAHVRLLMEPDFGRLVLLRAREMLDELEGEIAEAERAAKGETTK